MKREMWAGGEVGGSSQKCSCDCRKGEQIVVDYRDYKLTDRSLNFKVRNWRSRPTIDEIVRYCSALQLKL